MVVMKENGDENDAMASTAGGVDINGLRRGWWG